jgi:predicted O-methyltransferase YrrM
MADQTSTLHAYDRYIANLFAPEDGALKSARDESRRAGMPEINVSATEGKLLQVLARIISANRILEIGTLGGYSTIWLARALAQEGKLVTLEINAQYAAVARRNLERAGLLQNVEIKIGPAIDSLRQIQSGGELPFDMVFIDAAKEEYPKYLQAALPLLRDGGLVVADNTLPDSVLSPGTDHGAKRYNADVSGHPELISILVPVLRTRGIDGLLISLKRNSVRTEGKRV